MITGHRKKIDEILNILEPYKKIILIGCKGCVSICNSGGEKEVGIMSSLITISRKKDGKEIEIKELMAERQCDIEYIENINTEGYEAILSTGCGVGVQYLAEKYKMPVFPALNTDFLGGSLGQGIWVERCQGCGSCLLHLTGGICPITRCSKSILNGPCGGSSGGKCEINKEVECGWQLIIDRLTELGLLENYEQIMPCKDWSSARDGGPRKMIREDMME
jgi:ferredoxin